MAYAQPRPGQPIRRDGKPYIWVTWLAKLLGGQQCVWSAWFKAHFKYAKFEQDGAQLAEWNREHTALMRSIVDDLRENGWSVTVEGQNEFKLEGKAAVVAGKSDAIATMPGHVLVVDGKTGRERESDWWQVFIYLFALEAERPQLLAGNKVNGEVIYKTGDQQHVRMSDLNEARRDDLVRMIKMVASDTEPPRAPSRGECLRCNIGPSDCPQRFVESSRETTEVAAF